MATSKVLKPRRGSTAEHANFKGQAFEITFDTDKKTIVAHDGLSMGGFPLAHEAAVVETDNALRALINQKVSEVEGVASDEIKALESAIIAIIDANGRQQAARDASQDSVIVALESTLRTLIQQELEKKLATGGGTMAGSLIFKKWASGIARAEDDFNMFIAGGTAWHKGGHVKIYGQDSEVNAGCVELEAYKEDVGDTIVIMRPGQGLFVGGGKVITSMGGSMGNKLTFSSQRVIDSTNSNGLFIVADANVDSAKTGSLSCFPVEHSDPARNGGFEFCASDGENVKKLTGHFTRGLAWGAKPIITLEASGDDYLRYSDGTQICMQFIQATTSTNTITLPMPFIDTSYYFMPAIIGDDNHAHSLTLQRGDNTSYTCRANGQLGCHVVTIGKWK